MHRICLVAGSDMCIFALVCCQGCKVGGGGGGGGRKREGQCCETIPQNTDSLGNLARQCVDTTPRHDTLHETCDPSGRHNHSVQHRSTRALVVRPNSKLTLPTV